MGREKQHQPGFTIIKILTSVHRSGIQEIVSGTVAFLRNICDTSEVGVV